MQRIHLVAALAALAAAIAALPAAAPTTQFMVSGAPVTVGAQPASKGNGYSIYHYRSLNSPNSVTVNCSCDDGAKSNTASCN